METNKKFTEEYAKEMAFETSQKEYVSSESSFIQGYMKALEETGANNMLEALIKCSKINKIAREHISDELFETITNAINKATK